MKAILLSLLLPVLAFSQGLPIPGPIYFPGQGGGGGSGGVTSVAGLTGAVTAAALQNAPAATSALTESAGAVTINWATSSQFTLTLNANLATVTLSNLADGQTVKVAVTNTTGNYTVTWGNSIKWQGGSQPVQTVGTHTDIWTITDFAGTLYGNVVQDF